MCCSVLTTVGRAEQREAADLTTEALARGLVSVPIKACQWKGKTGEASADRRAKSVQFQFTTDKAYNTVQEPGDGLKPLLLNRFGG